MAGIEKKAYETLPKIHGWVERDRHGELTVTIGETEDETPFRDKGMWGSYYHPFTKLDNKLFPEVTWKSGPVEVELIIRKK
jgi:hypothetical protein